MTNFVVIGLASMLVTNRVEQLRPPPPDGSLATNMTVHFTVNRCAWVTCNWDGQVIVLSTNVPVLRFTRQYTGKMIWSEQKDSRWGPAEVLGK